eukprot:TRINITY_DN1661_c0_g1_i7.p1 TRINITY_DN1661_c0_g1~~TRINITY_DN1661_c0_g1_i7.p1  ORF type:complete len:916 (-),score=87.12 TRINITY_DN1661_c0_g1_i7:1233-3980(-)
MGFCQIIGWPSHLVHLFLSGTFYRLGKFAGGRPFIPMIIGIIIAVICGIGITRLEQDNEVFYMPSSRANKEENLIEDTFGEAEIQQRISRMIVVADVDVLEESALQSVYQDIHLRVLNEIRTDKGIMFADICIKAGETNDCAQLDFFGLLGLKSIQDIHKENIQQSLQENQDAIDLLGAVSNQTQGADIVISAKTVNLQYFTQNTDEAEEWEVAFIDYMKDNEEKFSNLAGLEDIHYWNAKGAEDETNRIVNQEQPLILASFGLILIYMCFILGGRPFVRSRFLLGLSCLFTVVLAFVFSLGLCGYFGVKFTIISILAGFVLLGVGVDDMIIIVDALKRTDPELDVPEAIGQAMKQAGHAITVTSFSSLVAFLIASSIDFLAIRYFCILAGLGILGVYIMQVTFFVGVLVLDERRMRSNRVDCCPCIKLPTEDSTAYNGPIGNKEASSNGEKQDTYNDDTAYKAKPPQEMSRDVDQEKDLAPDANPLEGRHYQPSIVRYVLVRILSPAISWGWLRALIILLFAGLLALMIVNTTRLSSNADTTDFYSDDSYLKPYYRAIAKYYTYSTIQAQFLAFGIEPFNVQQKVNYERVKDELMKLNAIFPPVVYWAEDMQLWEETRNESFPTDTQQGMTEFREFLNSQPFNYTLVSGTTKEVFSIQYESDIVPYEDAYATRMYFYYGWREQTDPNIQNLKEVRKVVDKYSQLDGVTYVVWEFRFRWTDRDAEMVRSMIQNLVYAALGVIASLFIFVHPATALFVGAVVVCVDICLLGLMNLWDMNLDVASFICVAMALGLAVDYVVHLATYFVSAKGTPQQRLLLTYADMGTSVFNGGFSTFLGVLVLVFAQSNGFRSFFKVMFGVVVFGMLFGLLFVPVILYQFQVIVNRLGGKTKSGTNDQGRPSSSLRDIEALEMAQQK